MTIQFKQKLMVLSDNDLALIVKIAFESINDNEARSMIAEIADLSDEKLAIFGETVVEPLLSSAEAVGWDTDEECDCCDPECSECNERMANNAEEAQMNEIHYAMEQREERELQKELEGGDDDDGDEEDPHGAHSIDDPSRN